MAERIGDGEHACASVVGIARLVAQRIGLADAVARSIVRIGGSVAERVGLGQFVVVDVVTVGFPRRSVMVSVCPVSLML